MNPLYDMGFCRVECHESDKSSTGTQTKLYVLPGKGGEGLDKAELRYIFDDGNMEYIFEVYPHCKGTLWQKI